MIQKTNNNKIKKTIKHISEIIMNKYLKITALCIIIPTKLCTRIIFIMYKF